MTEITPSAEEQDQMDIEPMELNLVWAAFAELDEAIADKGCACVQTVNFDCAVHRAFDRTLDVARARIEAMLARIAELEAEKEGLSK